MSNLLFQAERISRSSPNTGNDDDGEQFKTTLEAVGCDIEAKTRSITVDPKEIYEEVAWNNNFAARMYEKMRPLQPVLKLFQTVLGRTEPVSFLVHNDQLVNIF